MAPVSRRQAVFDAMPGTVPELMAKAKASRRTVWRWVKDLRGAEESHIGDWKRQPVPGPNLPVHFQGPGADVPCKFKPQSNKARWKKYKSRRSTEAHDLKKKKDRARVSVKKAIKHGDPLVRALFGRAQQPKGS